MAILQRLFVEGGPLCVTGTTNFQPTFWNTSKYTYTHHLYITFATSSESGTITVDYESNSATPMTSKADLASAFETNVKYRANCFILTSAAKTAQCYSVMWDSSYLFFPECLIGPTLTTTDNPKGWFPNTGSGLIILWGNFTTFTVTDYVSQKS